MELKFENLQRAAYTFDRNLNTNLNIAPNESKHEFCCKGQIDKKSTRNSLQGAHRQDFLDLSKILEKSIERHQFRQFLRIGRAIFLKYILQVAAYYLAYRYYICTGTAVLQRICHITMHITIYLRHLRQGQKYGAIALLENTTTHRHSTRYGYIYPPRFDQRTLGGHIYAKIV